LSERGRLQQSGRLSTTLPIGKLAPRLFTPLLRKLAPRYPQYLTTTGSRLRWLLVAMLLLEGRTTSHLVRRAQQHSTRFRLFILGHMYRQNSVLKLGRYILGQDSLW
jgi:hypothetical protein